MFRGVIIILLACLIWSIIFVIPRFMPDVDPLEIALGRYAFFGLTSLFILAVGRFQLLKKIDLALWIKAFWLGLAGNIFYYFALVTCMRCSGAAISALLLGISPVAIAWLANWCNREYYFRNLILSSCFTAIGLVLVNFPALQESSIEGTVGTYILGLLAGFIALGMWCWYAISSKVVLTRYVNLTPADWSTLLGLATLLSVLMVAAGYLVLNWNSPQVFYRLEGAQFFSFILGSAILGIPCSWIGFYLWSLGSTKISVALSGQLLIFETIFGLILLSILDHRAPLLMETIGMAFLFLGIILALFQKKIGPSQLEGKSAHV